MMALSFDFKSCFESSASIAGTIGTFEEIGNSKFASQLPHHLFRPPHYFPRRNQMRGRG